ncbi:hypothetical protein D9M72_468740 [compost metagenome]
MRHPLVLIEHLVGQGMAFPPHIQSTIGIGIGLDIATSQAACHLGLLEHDPLALERKRQLRSNIALLTFAQDVAQPIRGEIQRAVQVIGSGRDDRKPRVVVLYEARQKPIASLHVVDTGQP